MAKKGFINVRGIVTMTNKISVKCMECEFTGVITTEQEDVRIERCPSCGCDDIYTIKDKNET